MKAAFCFLALAVAYACAETCTETSTCDTTVTTCGGTAALACVNRVCTCSNGDGTGALNCTMNADCHHQHLHHCNKGHWMCQAGHCHCGQAP
ncbi:uncharacterized protein LOC128204262 [Mya arenaria]|uniref:uncharacterized protein LOC128204262 n=1 Tax=Mya arenaria TaxID=6604 RepID=UPI0022E2463A|nr:uncharacterized protein LOC128204262 [Mya arenaria]